ncbi:GntR family transcriptional regulator [Pseudokineococcus lusitanus]|uniref:DNA-binding transcriptional regulator YhcF (GntR family) n=1 Tax=Pseudokineococcus lusitanus TaxID=763993 RepID=A0A3N1HTD4_9ACTN|nr:DNA-binding transcriptional regulator YhcF (GntR family) [Pseudokineococcus lusitanus]
MNLLSVDAGSPVPPYEQLRSQVVAAVDAGDLAPGERLPPVRRLAADLGVAAGTVARAYKELEADGVVETRGRAGTVVAPRGDAEAEAVAAAGAYAERVRRLGLDPERAVALVRAALGPA